MFELGLQQCARAIDNANLLSGDVRFSRVSTDTRTLDKGDLFVALIGEHFDAHDKIDSEVMAKAAGLVVQKTIDGDIPQLLVDDTLRALGDIARLWRKQVSAPVIAITGSNGKTTVKEMTAAILRQRGAVFATKGNLNNEIGLPLSLLSTAAEHDFVVLELGANHAGEIAYLVDIASPAVALVNNAGAAHLEGFGSLDGVAKAKGEIYGGLDKDGTAIINVDDHYAAQWRQTAGERKVIGFGFGASADVRGLLDSSGELTIHYQNNSTTLLLPLRGRHNAMNALAAAAAAIAVGTSLDQVAAGLQTVIATSGRLEFKTGRGGTEIIDDSYNANPDSLHVGLQVLCDKALGATWCVLGDMRELGEHAAKLHHDMGSDARKSGVDHLLAIGEFAEATVDGFGSDGHAFAELPELLAFLQSALKSGDRVLVKGSRGARMERVVEALVDLNENSASGGNR